MESGDLLRKLRHKKNLTQNQVALQVGVSQSTYFAWEAGRSSPNAKYIAKLAMVLNCEIKSLININTLVDASHIIDSNTALSSIDEYKFYKELVLSQKQIIILQQQRIEFLENKYNVFPK